jgi:tetratricopeptide (TPR) repeat protein
MQETSVKRAAAAPTPAPAAVAAAPQASLWAWFHPVNWLAAFIAFGASLATYVYTLQPTVGLEDSGELITGAYRLGVPHPPGYPAWAIIGKLFCLIPIGDVGYRVNLMSAVCGALAAGMVALVLAKTGDFFFSEQEEELGAHHLLPVFERFGLTTPRLVNSLCAIAAGVLFAYTPGTWSQSTIAEVYAMNAFFMAMVVTLSLVFMFNPQRRIALYLAAFFFALGVTVHQTITVMVFSFAWLAFATKRSMEEFLNLAANAIILLVFTLAVFNSQQYFGHFGIPDLRMLPFNGALFGNFFTCFVGVFLIYLAVAYYVNKKFFNSTEWVKIVAWFFAGLAVYFYLPLSSVTNPQMNWGRPRTVEGFWHSILRGQYEKPSFRRPLDYFLDQTSLYLKDTWDQYPMVLIFAFISIVALMINWRRTRVRDWLIYSIITFVACGVGMVFMMNPKLDITSQYINRVFFIMGHAGLGLLVGYGMMVTAAALFPLAHKHRALWRAPALLIGGVLAMYGAVFMTCAAEIALTKTAALTGFVAHSVSVPEHMRVPFYLVFGGVFTLVGVLVIIGVVKTQLSYAASVLIALLFVATPAISAIENWREMNLRTKYFGYVFGIEMLKVCEPGTIFFGGTDPGRFVPEYLIGCNEFRGDIWLITQNGLADATYMNVLRDRYCKPQTVWPWVRSLLRWVGAEREDPLRQEQGGRDPKLGKIYIPSQQDFERAFQIYIKDVEDRKKRGEPIEEDVQIVGGKISVGGVSGVMRLNGILAEMIWTNNINRHAFYVEESYVIPWMYPYLEPAGLIMRLNRDKVQLTPDKVARDFAYWDNLTNMFAAGGVIDYDDVVALYWRALEAALKANPNAPRDTVVSQAWARAVSESVSVENMPLHALPSRDYLNAVYDWCKAGKTLYFAQERGRIVIKPGEFEADEPAQKSFSKARSATAGVYEFHQMWPEAEAAYRQALWLYPKSAEAYMRLASMYVRLGRFDDALALAEEYKTKDPLNDRVDGMIDIIRRQRDSNRALVELQQRVQAGTNVTWTDYLQMSQMYEQQGNRGAADGIYERLLTDAGMTNAEVFQYLLAVFNQRQDLGKMTRLFERVTQVRPKDWSAWLDLSVARMANGDMNGAFACIDKAIALDREKTVRRLAQDPRVQMLKNHPDDKLRNRFLKYIE